MAYIGKTPTVGNFQVCDAISVVNGQAAYTLQVGSANVIPQSANHMIVSLNGVIQKPGSSFTVSGSTMTFASNLATGDSIDFVQILGNVLDIGTPSDGTVTESKIGSGAVTSSKLSAGKILQVVGTQTDTVFSTTSTSFVDVTGFSLSITPSSTSNKILVLLDFMYGNSGSYINACQLKRNTDVIALGDPVNNLGNVYLAHGSAGQGFGNFGINYLDTPNSTSALTYKLQVLTASGGTLKINSRNDNNDSSERIGSLTLMEVSG